MRFASGSAALLLAATIATAAVHSIAAVAHAEGDPFLERKWLQYNFIPGERIVFAEDFADADTAGARARFDALSGSAKVEASPEWRGLRFDRATTLGLGMNEGLAPNFTIEFDLEIGEGSFELLAAGADTADARSTRLRLTGSHGALIGGDLGRKEGSFAASPTRHQVSLLVEGTRARLWVDAIELLDAPNSNFPRTNQLQLRATPREDEPIRVGNLRIATILRPLSATRFKAEPFINLHGITWDGEALRPESAATLRWLVDTLRHDPTLRLRLTVHDGGANGAGSSLFSTVKVRPDASSHVSPSFSVNTFASDAPPSL